MASLQQQLVLKEGGIFLLSHENGDVIGNSGLGLYYQDLRYLSLLSFKLNGEPPPLLNFSGYRNFMGTLQYTNQMFRAPTGEAVLPETISIRRSRFVSLGLHERIGLASYNRFPVPLTVSLSFGADFRDIFDVRGFHREKWGELLPPTWDAEACVITLRYVGLDGVVRNTVISFDRTPDAVDIDLPANSGPIFEPTKQVPVVGLPSYHIIIEPAVATLTWDLVLENDSPVSFAFHVLPEGAPERDMVRSLIPSERADPDSPTATAFLVPPTPSGDGMFDKAVNYMRFSYWNWEKQCTEFQTGNEELNQVLTRSKIDLRVLSEPVGDGYFPSAGIPWYTCPFGRDSIITALQTLVLNPLIAVGTLRTLARFQGTHEDPWREEQPGKILHELRQGEMARLGLVPHSPYYGSVDATPLFVLLFVETMKWLDDDKLYQDLLPNVLLAVDWIDKYGDVDRDGFVEYVGSASNEGIRNQVWKDSSDSIQMLDGTLAETPIAAVEVQGYVYAARKGLAQLLRRKGGDEALAERLERQAEELRVRFNQAFWMPDAGFFAQGLDKDKRQVPAISSNPGHCLWCGIVDEDKARPTVERLMQPDMVSGWGIRTISNKWPSYNPMSYHNGSIWPHDNSIIVAGFKRYGFHDEANEVVTQIQQAAEYFRYYRLPELYCGFRRDNLYQSGPAEYPVSCSPQAWAAGAPILMLQAILGLDADGAQRQVIARPRLPGWLDWVRLSNLRVGEQRASLTVRRHDGQDEVNMSSESPGMALIVS